MILLRALILGIVSSLVLLHVSAWANTPTQLLRMAIQDVIRILEDPTLKPEAKAPERQARVRAAVSGLFDFPEIARRALGRHWRPLTESEREEFVRLFHAFLEHTYLPKIALYQGEQVRFLSESVNRDRATVRTVLITPRGQDISVTYRLGRHAGRWLVFDMIVEGVSLTANYRAQFNQIILRASFQELVRRIKRKLAAPVTTHAAEPEPPRTGPEGKDE